MGCAVVSWVFRGVSTTYPRDAKRTATAPNHSKLTLIEVLHSPHTVSHIDRKRRSRTIRVVCGEILESKPLAHRFGYSLPPSRSQQYQQYHVRAILNTVFYVREGTTNPNTVNTRTVPAFSGRICHEKSMCEPCASVCIARISMCENPSCYSSDLSGARFGAVTVRFVLRRGGYGVCHYQPLPLSVISRDIGARGEVKVNDTKPPSFMMDENDSRVSQRRVTRNDKMWYSLSRSP